MTTIGSFALVKNEAPFIKAHLESWLPLLDEMVFFDGNSTDGTLEILREWSQKSHKVRLFENKDPKDLQDDYVRTFDQCLHELRTDYAAYLHPDMICRQFKPLDGKEIAYTTSMTTFAGNPGGQLYRLEGRAKKWKNIYRLKNPDLGLHYFGHYGAANEDCYFRDITHDYHDYFGEDFNRYAYDVGDSRIEIDHYSDVRTYERRLDKMVKCLTAQGYSKAAADAYAPLHPRVSLKSDDNFRFEPVAEASLC